MCRLQAIRDILAEKQAVRELLEESPVKDAHTKSGAILV
jgi:hypothetical protein